MWCRRMWLPKRILLPIAVEETGMGLWVRLDTAASTLNLGFLASRESFISPLSIECEDCASVVDHNTEVVADTQMLRWLRSFLQSSMISETWTRREAYWCYRYLPTAACCRDIPINNALTLINQLISIDRVPTQVDWYVAHQYMRMRMYPTGTHGARPYWRGKLKYNNEPTLILRSKLMNLDQK